MNTSDATMLSLLCTLLLVAMVTTSEISSDSAADNSDMAANQVLRSFGQSSGQNSFASDHNKDMIDWDSILASQGISKRQLEGYNGGGFGGLAGGLDNGKFQNWNKYFGRNYRAFRPNQRTGGLGTSGGFGTDGLQNWQAFFDSRRGQGFRK